MYELCDEMHRYITLYVQRKVALFLTGEFQPPTHMDFVSDGRRAVWDAGVSVKVIPASDTSFRVAGGVAPSHTLRVALGT